MPTLKKTKKSKRQPPLDPAIDIAIFIKTMALSIQAGLDFVSFCERFIEMRPKSKISQELSQKTSGSVRHLQIENVSDVLKKYPHPEASFISGTLSCAINTGASVSHILEEHLHFIKIAPKKFTNLNNKEKLQMWFFLRMCARAICCGLNILQAWQIAKESLEGASTNCKWLTDLTHTEVDVLVSNIRKLSQKRNDDQFLESLAFAIELFAQTGGDLANFIDWMATQIRPS